MKEKSIMQNYLRYILVISTCLAVGYLSGMVTQDSVTTWYATLKKPFFNPPNWVFMPVWTLLYIAMGVAAARVWSKENETNYKVVRKALLFFIIQLALNALWTILFFGIKNPLLALVEIVLLWLMIYETYTQFKKIDAFSAKLLIPYLAWVSFASILNASVWWLNK